MAYYLSANIDRNWWFIIRIGSEKSQSIWFTTKQSLFKTIDAIWRSFLLKWFWKWCAVARYIFKVNKEKISKICKYLRHSFKKNHETYYRSARLRVLTSFRQFYLCWTIFFIYLGVSWSVSIYLDPFLTIHNWS